jgi:uncharacterized protein (DUF1499 family)
MSAASVKIENKKYRIIPEEYYISLMNDVKVLKKILKSSPGKDLHAKDALKESEKKRLFKKSFGAFESSQSAEEIINEIRNSRTFNLN